MALSHKEVNVYDEMNRIEGLTKLKKTQGFRKKFLQKWDLRGVTKPYKT